MLYSTHHNATEIARLKLGHRELDGLQHVGHHPLPEEGVEIDGSSEQLHVSLFQDGHVAVGRRVRELVWLTIRPEPLVKVNAAEMVRGNDIKVYARLLKPCYDAPTCKLHSNVRTCTCTSCTLYMDMYMHNIGT